MLPLLLAFNFSATLWQVAYTITEHKREGSIRSLFGEYRAEYSFNNFCLSIREWLIKIKWNLWKPKIKDHYT